MFILIYLLNYNSVCFLFLNAFMHLPFSQVFVYLVSILFQRRRTAVDELNMRTIFEENDVICVCTIPHFLACIDVF